MQVVLVRPQIATNTGNIIRLCANVGAALHLVEPLGFTLDSASLRRAGLDYHELTSTTVHPSLGAALAAATTGLSSTIPAATDSSRTDPSVVCPTTDSASADLGRSPGRAYALTASAARLYTDVAFDGSEVLVFGTERTGLSDDDLQRFPPDQRLRIPMRPDNRSLNLANAVAVITYEAWRQQGFAGAATAGVGTTAEGLIAGSASSTQPS